MKSKKTKKRGGKIGAEGTAGIRASISFTREMYKTLEGIAAEKKVSLAWVVREAVEKYIADKWPLFSKKD
jgi:predicted DNA-binding ribbon-helix-helix protein